MAIPDYIRLKNNFFTHPYEEFLFNIVFFLHYGLKTQYDKGTIFAKMLETVIRKSIETMVKFLTIVLLLTALGGGTYYLLSMETVEDVKVMGKLQISEQYGSYVMASQSKDANYYAVVEGKVKNNMKKPIKNVFIKYVIAGKETSATIFDLAPGQELHFNTSGVATTGSSPEYDFVGIYYD